MNLRQQSQYGSLGRQARQSKGSHNDNNNTNNTNVPQDTAQSQDQDDFLRDVLKCRDRERESLTNDFNYLYDKIRRIKERINIAQSAAGEPTASTKPQVIVSSAVSQQSKVLRHSSLVNPPLQPAEIIRTEQIAPSSQLSTEQISANEMLSKWLQIPNSQLNEDSDGMTQQNLGNAAFDQFRCGKLTENAKSQQSKEVSQTHKRMQDLLSEMNVDYSQILPEIDSDAAQNLLTLDSSSPLQSQNIVVLDDISIINIQKLIIAKLSQKADEIKAEKEQLASRLISQSSSSSFQIKQQVPTAISHQ